MWGGAVGTGGCWYRWGPWVQAGVGCGCNGGMWVRGPWVQVGAMVAGRGLWVQVGGGSGFGGAVVALNHQTPSPHPTPLYPRAQLLPVVAASLGDHRWTETFLLPAVGAPAGGGQRRASREAGPCGASPSQTRCVRFSRPSIFSIMLLSSCSFRRLSNCQRLSMRRMSETMQGAPRWGSGFITRVMGAE